MRLGSYEGDEVLADRLRQAMDLPPSEADLDVLLAQLIHGSHRASTADAAAMQAADSRLDSALQARDRPDPSRPDPLLDDKTQRVIELFSLPRPLAQLVAEERMSTRTAQALYKKMLRRVDGRPDRSWLVPVCMLLVSMALLLGLWLTVA